MSAVQDLVLSEIVEVTIPVLFTVCFMLAYFGPNADNLGNIKNGYFHYSAVEDIWGAFKMLLIIMGIDFSLLVINFGILYKFAGVNMLKVTIITLTYLDNKYKLQGLPSPSEGVWRGAGSPARISCHELLLPQFYRVRPGLDFSV